VDGHLACNNACQMVPAGGPSTVAIPVKPERKDKI